MTKHLVIIGSGNQFRVIVSTLQDEEFKFVINATFDEDINKLDINKNIFHLSNFKKILKEAKLKTVYGLVAIGNNDERSRIVKKINKLKILNFKWLTFVSKKSITNKSLRIGEGSFIMPGVIVNNNVKIGKHCIINTGAVVDHDCKIDDYSNLCPRVTLCGNVRLKQNTFLGSGTTVVNDITINTNCNIYAMSLVTKDCEKNSIYAGIPSKKILK